MTWDVTFTKKAARQRDKLAPRERAVLDFLLFDLQLSGPVQPSWPNYSKFGEGEHHCHLRHKWVACWRVNAAKIELIEVYYVGSRENAPY
jgi:mRNA-degrading endonuclease RelE of RelBE toxin-antitoxin system